MAISNDMDRTTWPTLYKTTSTGKEQQWHVEVLPVRDPLVRGLPNADIVVTHGQVDGKLQVATVRVAKGKNLGKKNATTPVQQAIDEADAKYKKQLDKGYAVTRGGASMAKKPMLAHKYEDNREKVTFPCFWQPKLDGIRCLASRNGDTVELVSRMGKPFKELDHIRRALLFFMKDGDTFDGELFRGGTDFQTISSLVKKPQPDSLRVQYHVYDLVEPKLSFGLRWGRLLDRYAEGELRMDHPHRMSEVPLVTTGQLVSHEAVMDAHARSVDKGYEGIMLRVGDCTYKEGYRSRQLLKVKAFKDQEFKVVDVEEGVGKEAGKAIFVCETDAGERFNCRPKGTDAQREAYWKFRKDEIGRKLTVKFFEWTAGERPVPRFPVGVAIRDYEW